MPPMTQCLIAVYRSALADRSSLVDLVDLVVVVGGGGGCSYSDFLLPHRLCSQQQPHRISVPDRLDRDELEDKSMREHVGVLYFTGGDTTKQGTLVCIVLYRGAEGQLSGSIDKWLSSQCYRGVIGNVVWF